MRRSLSFLLPMLLALAARPAAAQRRAETSFATLPPPALAADTTPHPAPYLERVVVRGGSALLGGAVGAVVVGAVGYSLDDSEGEDAHLLGTVYGVTLGTVLGTAGGAAFPRSARCGFGRRFSHALLSTFLATSLGAGVVWAMDPSGEKADYPLLLVGLGGVMAAAVSAEC